MAKINLTDLTSTQASSIVSNTNANNALIEAAVENTLSRDGTTPNQMLSNLDMNSNRIVNLPVPVSDTEPVRYGEFNSFTSGMSGAVTQAETAATNAANSAIAAEVSRVATDNALDQFTDLYLGAKSSEPSVDNDGNALVTGALYFDTTGNQFKAWSGSVWSTVSNTGDGDKGDLTITVGGTVWTIDAGVVSNSKLRDSVGVSVIGRSVNSTGAPADIVASADGQFLQRVSGSLSFAVPTAGQITNTPAGNIAATTVQTALNELDTEKQPIDSDLTALAANTTAGLWASTAIGSGSARTLTAPAAGITITNPAGTAGNPTFVLANDLGAIEGLSGTGFATRTGTDTWVQRVVTGTAAEVTVTNGDGVSGAPTISLPTAITLTGKTLTGGTFASPSLTTPSLGVATATSINGATITSGTLNGTVTGTNTGDQTITLTSDVTGSGTGSFATTISANAVTNAKAAQMATQTFKGRTTAGTGNPEDLTIAQAKTMLNLTGTNSGDQTITLTGDVTGSGTSSFAATIPANTVTNAKAAQMAAGTIKGNNTGGTANATDLTAAQTTAMLDTVVGDSGSGGTKGLVPAPAAGDAALSRFLKADGTWSTPAGGGGGSPGGSNGNIQYNNSGSFGGLTDADVAARVVTAKYAQKTGAYTVVAADRGKTIDIATNAVTLSLDAAATLGDGFYFFTENSNTTAGNYLTIDPNGAETIDGLSTIVDPPGIERMVYTDGTGWRSKIIAGSNIEPVYTPAALAANTNDYDPLVKGASGIVRVSASATIQVTGLVGGAQGARRVLVNVGTIDILLKNENASSTAANRFAFSLGSFILGPNKSIELYYDVASSRWRPTTMPDARQRVILPADVTNGNAVANTLADITGLSFPVVSGQMYKFTISINFTTAATTTGSRWTINAPTTTLLRYTSRYTLTATSETINHLNAINLPAASNASSLISGQDTAIIEGTLKPSANGTVQGRFASEVASSNVVAAGLISYVEYEAVGD